MVGKDGVRILIIGDTHGNSGWLRRYAFPTAIALGADAIVVVGDFGAWEHTRSGVQFFDNTDRLSQLSGIPLYWLHGNHDKFSHTLATYTGLDDNGFVQCRDNLFYIPQGASWTWSGVRLRAFGGAYSIDKSWRVNQEKMRYAHLLRQARYKAANDIFKSDLAPSQAGTLWFPEEEMTDSDMEQMLLDDFGRKDIILTHDKPLSAKPDWNRKDYPACVPNQLRLDRALRLHKPSFWVHGHLHYHYVDQVYGPDWMTTVIGLDPDNNAAEHDSWQRPNTWVLAELRGEEDFTVTLGRLVQVDQAKVNQARELLPHP